MDSTIIFPVLFLVSFLVGLFLIVIPTWKIFTKAGQSGWKCLIPVYNSYILVVISGLPWWVFLGMFIPAINFVVVIVVMYYLSERFGHGMGYALGLIFLPFIFLPILGYGDAAYSPKVDVSAETPAASAPESSVQTATVPAPEAPAAAAPAPTI